MLPSIIAFPVFFSGVDGREISVGQHHGVCAHPEDEDPVWSRLVTWHRSIQQVCNRFSFLTSKSNHWAPISSWHSSFQLASRTIHRGYFDFAFKFSSVICFYICLWYKLMHFNKTFMFWYSCFTFFLTALTVTTKGTWRAWLSWTVTGTFSGLQ